MDVEKYIFIPTNQGNYVIARVTMETKVDTQTQDTFFVIKNKSKIVYRVPMGLKSRYDVTTCFDSKGDALIYAEKMIKEHLNKMIKAELIKVEYHTKRAEKISTKKPSKRYYDLAFVTK